MKINKRIKIIISMFSILLLLLVILSSCVKNNDEKTKNTNREEIVVSNNIENKNNNNSANNANNNVDPDNTDNNTGSTDNNTGNDENNVDPDNNENNDAGNVDPDNNENNTNVDSNENDNANNVDPDNTDNNTGNDENNVDPDNNENNTNVDSNEDNEDNSEETIEDDLIIEYVERFKIKANESNIGANIYNLIEEKAIEKENKIISHFEYLNGEKVNFSDTLEKDETIQIVYKKYNLDNFEFEIENNKAYITKIKEAVEELVIPNVYKGVNVIGFKSSGPSYAPVSPFNEIESKYIFETIIIPSSFEVFTEDLFKGFDNLDINEVLFQSRKNKKNRNKITDYLFSSYAGRLDNLDFSGIKVIGKYALSATSLEFLDLSNTDIEKMEIGALSTNNNLLTLYLPEKLEILENTVLHNSVLENLYVFSNLKEIEEGAYLAANTFTDTNWGSWGSGSSSGAGGIIKIFYQGSEQSNISLENRLREMLKKPDGTIIYNWEKD